MRYSYHYGYPIVTLRIRPRLLLQAIDMLQQIVGFIQRALHQLDQLVDRRHLAEGKLTRP